jgi:hypothetical protein
VFTGWVWSERALDKWLEHLSSEQALEQQLEQEMV